MPDRVESIAEVDRSKNRPRARLGFVKPIRNELREKQNLIKSTPSRVETDLMGKENGVKTPEKRADAIEQCVQKALRRRK